MLGDVTFTAESVALVDQNGWLDQALSDIHNVFGTDSVYQSSTTLSSNQTLNQISSWAKTNWKWLLIGGVAGLIIFKRR